MNERELKRILSHKPNGHTDHPDPDVTMSEAVFGLTDLAHIQQTPAIAEMKLLEPSYPVFTNPSGHTFSKLEDALRFGNQRTWKLAEYYVDNAGLFLVFLPSSRELATVAQQQLESISTYVDDEQTAREIYAKNLVEQYGLVLKVTGDYRLYFDFGNTADHVEGTINGQGGQSTIITKVNRTHCLRRATYKEGAKRMTLTNYC